MFGIMVVIAWLAIRESRREDDEELRRMAEKYDGRGRADPAFLTSGAAQPRFCRRGTNSLAATPIQR